MLETLKHVPKLKSVVVLLSPDQGTMFYSGARSFTLIVMPLFTRVYKWVQANLKLGVTLQLTNIQAKEKYFYSFHAIFITSHFTLPFSSLWKRDLGDRCTSSLFHCARMRRYILCTGYQGNSLIEVRMNYQTSYCSICQQGFAENKTCIAIIQNTNKLFVTLSY